MKSIIKFVLLVFVLSILSCSKDDDYVSATLIGYDLRLCPCCGGVLVKLEDGKTYQWYQKNEKFGTFDNNSFPIAVQIKYHHLVESCVSSAGEIEITALKLK